jgi:DNA-binding NtrC family response regulator
MSSRILIVDDDASLCSMLAEGLRLHGFESIWETSAQDALTRASNEDFDVVVTDINMRGMSGIDLCRHIAETRSDVPVVVITAFGSLDTAVAAIRAGAYDFVTKPFDIDAIAIVLERAAKHHQLREEVRRLRQAVSETQRFDELIGASAPMRKVYDLLERLSQSDATVLVTGESGTGKELVARALHRRSKRAEGPFVAVNCAAVPEALLESELFGHVRGAFTDAKATHTGLLAQSSGGTFFLDEIGDMPLGLQPKLLRALEERVVRPVGAEKDVSFDARIVAATHRDIESLVEEGRFREDLYYRINVVHLEMPPLRARGGDILLLAQNYVERFASQTAKPIQGISSQAAEKLLAYSWPGNVREIRNCMERAVALTRHTLIAAEDLPEKVRDFMGSHVIVAGNDPSELVPLDEVERRYILKVMDAVRGNKTMAAQVLGLDRKTLYRKLERYGVLGGPKSGVQG